jgi:hypothetical protein
LAKTEYDPGAMINVIENLLDITVSNNQEIPISQGFKLLSNYPNPFNPSTNIRFSVKTQRSITLQIYDLNGRMIETLIDKIVSPGEHEVQWNTQNQPSGIYLIRLQSGEYFTAQKISLVK